MLLAFGKDRNRLEHLINREFLKIEPYFDNWFIKSHHHLGKTEVLQLGETFCIKHHNVASYPIENYRYGGQIYFELFLAGLAQFVKNNKQVDPQNIFVRFLKQGVQFGKIDQALIDVVENESWFIKKITDKYDDAMNILEGNVDMVPPVEIVPDPKGSLKFTTTTGEDIRCEIFDGHHRFFMCELVSAEKIPFLRNDVNVSALTPQFTKSIAPNYTLEIR